jgi:hypothetical protein
MRNMLITVRRGKTEICGVRKIWEGWWTKYSGIVDIEDGRRDQKLTLN